MAIAAGDLPDEPVRAGAALAGDRRSDDAAVDLRLAGLDGVPVAQQPQLREPRGIGSLKVSWTWVGPVASSAPSAGTTERSVGCAGMTAGRACAAIGVVAARAAPAWT